MNHQRTILLVDDDADIREALTDILSDEGYAIEAVGNGQEALERLRSGPRPCLILLDLMMPVMDGHEFRRRQKADPDLEGIPVVVLTAMGAYRGAVDATAVLSKPVDLTTLLETVARFCDPDTRESV